MAMLALPDIWTKDVDNVPDNLYVLIVFSAASNGIWGD
jgi:hypothetical protein